MDCDENPFQATVAPLEQMETILPRMLENLSIGRAQIAIDQLSMAVRDSPDQVVFVTVSSGATEPGVVAAAIVLHANQATPTGPSEAATLVHSAPLAELNDATMTRVATELSRFTDTVLRDRGVRFVQWATDPILDTTSTSPGSSQQSDTEWCCKLGFEPIAKLEYLAGPIKEHDGRSSAQQDLSGLEFVGIDWEGADRSLDNFAKLVSSTYISTLDCPRLAEFRSAPQTLAGYQQSGAFTSQLWFRVFDRREPSGEPVGCVILSDHSRSAHATSGAIELVYMGLVPEARGRGLGRQMLQQAILLAGRFGAARMIMAVDQDNQPARLIYHQAGFGTILTESVWVKSI